MYHINPKLYIKFLLFKYKVNYLIIDYEIVGMLLILYSVTTVGFSSVLILSSNSLPTMLFKINKLIYKYLAFSIIINGTYTVEHEK